MSINWTCLDTIKLNQLDKVNVQKKKIIKKYKKIEKNFFKGSFGVAVLYRRKRDHNLVVLKQINLANLTASEKELAMNEVDVFSKLHHPNIIW